MTRFRLMRLPTAFAAILLGMAALHGPARATSGPIEREIDALLRLVRASPCAFVRNGWRFGGTMAAHHLHDRFLDVRDRIKTTEEFIEDIVTASRQAGDRYAVECAPGRLEAGETWLRNLLGVLRRGEPARP